MREHLWAIEHCTVPGILASDVANYDPSVVLCWFDCGREASMLWGGRGRGREGERRREREGERRREKEGRRDDGNKK